MILNCAIIDDEPLALDLLANYVGKTPFLNLAGRYANAVLAVEGLQAQPADVVFCDIQMPGIDGLAFANVCLPIRTLFSPRRLDNMRSTVIA